MGMAVVSVAVEENRGRIEIESSESRGTVCRLRLPRVAEAESEEGF